MFHDFINNTKQVCKDILPVVQHCIDIKFKPLFGIFKSCALYVFPQVVRLWNSLPKDITNTEDKTNFSKKLKVF